ncbi:DUF2460 domain-containing protein [Cupriavidus malaysiensis]|uniref:DUF2460 domain-containing protein n=1 Tax=Cupriavidus malaysiensis TaxID=367825 RepID=A0ABM6F3H8_9BURK|nr:DUF2460 domain-containing protein [Cupriavidus malaysiensis]AOZ05967.1 hypothetical protein BKK80_09095 [Cupriavidus malaysiensis]
MSNAIFPELAGIRPDRPRAPRFKTQVLEAASGREFRASRMANPIYRFSLGFEFLRESNGRAELRTLEGFYLARRGSFDSWLYRCAHDRAAADQLFGYGDGARTQFQLARSYGEFMEPVQNVEQIQGMRRGELLLPASAYTISPTGVVLFAQPPANGVPLRWTGTFFFRCRFESDDVSFDRIARNLYKAPRIEFRGSLGVKL